MDGPGFYTTPWDVNVDDDAYRYEQLSEFVSQVLEHLLPWLLNTLIAWVNSGLDNEFRLCPDLPAYLRFGVDTPIGLELASSGVRSRRLVHVVAREAEDQSVREWLAEMDLRSWSERFAASPSELADLLFFTRARDARLTSRVLAGEVVEIPVLVTTEEPSGPVDLAEAEEAAPARIGLMRAETVLAHVRPEHHDDLSRLLAVGVPIVSELTDEGALRIRVEDPAARAAWFEPE